MKIKMSFLKRVLLLKGVRYTDFVSLFVAFLIVSLIIVPLIWYFWGKHEDIIEEKYCYQIINGQTFHGVGVASSKDIPRLLKYYSNAPGEPIKIPSNDSFVMDTVKITMSEKIQVMQYNNQLGVAKIKVRNPWYKSYSKVESKYRIAHVPIIFLHFNPPLSHFEQGGERTEDAEELKR